MPGLDCRCGHRISYGRIPCPDEWLFISDVDYDGVTGAVDAEELYKKMNSFLRCPQCRRVWIFWRGFQSEAEEFLPASPAAGVQAGAPTLPPDQLDSPPE